jgi:hypothetical protein
MMQADEVKAGEERDGRPNDGTRTIPELEAR